MNIAERVKMVRAMETLCRNINDEYVFEYWLMYGVADGDIDEDTTDEEVAEYCEDDELFADLMNAFLHCMSRAYRSGGLYCDRVVSKKS